MSGRQVNRYRRRKRGLRSMLQQKRTKSAARVLKRQRRRAARYATQRNHMIAKGSSPPLNAPPGVSVWKT